MTTPNTLQSENPTYLTSGACAYLDIISATYHHRILDAFPHEDLSTKNAQERDLFAYQKAKELLDTTERYALANPRVPLSEIEHLPEGRLGWVTLAFPHTRYNGPVITLTPEGKTLVDEWRACRGLDALPDLPTPTPIKGWDA